MRSVLEGEAVAQTSRCPPRGAPFLCSFGAVNQTGAGENCTRIIGGSSRAVALRVCVEHPGWSCMRSREFIRFLASTRSFTLLSIIPTR